VASGLRKITVEVDAQQLASAQALTDKGVTETVRAALQNLASRWAQRELLKLEGKFDLGIPLKDLIDDYDDSR
jgi:hypothetical protein